MASKANLFFLLAFLFVATATPLASAALYNGKDVQGLMFLGRATCSKTPYPEPFVQGIKDVEIRIYCNGGSTSVAEALTDSNGLFTALGNTLHGITFEQTSLPCFATAELPGDQSCSGFLPKSILTSTISLVGTLSQHPIVLFANAAATHFVPAH